MLAIELTGVEIVVGIAAVLFGPAATGYFGSRGGLNGLKRDMAQARADIGEIRSTLATHTADLRSLTHEATAARTIAEQIQAERGAELRELALAQQRIETVIEHCEWIHNQPVSEHAHNRRKDDK